MATGKSLTPEEHERLERAVRDLSTRYANQKELAEALEVSQQMVSFVLAGTRPAGVHFATKVAKLLGYKSYMDVVGENPVPLYKNSGNWRELEEEFLRVYPGVPPHVLELARETPAYRGKNRYDLQDMSAVVVWVWKMATDDELAAAATRFARRRADEELVTSQPPSKALPSSASKIRR